jgi:hypothetical protein
VVEERAGPEVAGQAVEGLADPSAGGLVAAADQVNTTIGPGGTRSTTWNPLSPGMWMSRKSTSTGRAAI